MRKSPAIVDTNVVVSGLLSAHGLTPAVRILDSMLDGALTIVLSAALVAELQEVLGRAPLRKLHGLSSTNIDSVLATLVQHAIMLQPPPNEERALGPTDQHLWDLLAMREDLVLVTGDKLLLQSSRQDRILSPQQFLSE